MQGELKTFSKKDIKFIYRGSDFNKDLIILSVTLEGKPGNKNEIKKKQEEFINKKRN